MTDFRQSFTIKFIKDDAKPLHLTFSVRKTGGENRVSLADTDSTEECGSQQRGKESMLKDKTDRNLMRENVYAIGATVFWYLIAHGYRF